MGGKIDNSINNGNAAPIFRMQEDEKSNIHVDVVADIKEVLDVNNVLAKSFRNARAEIEANPRVEIKMRLIGNRTTDARTYNLPTASEVAALIVGDLDPSIGNRDILVESKSGLLKRISELNPCYLPMQYPLLFPYGEDGYREDIQFAGTSNRPQGGRHRVSPREYFAFRIHERTTEVSTILYSRRLFQQFLVDAYTIVESGGLIYIRTNQKALRCEAYKGLSDAVTRGEVYPSTLGKRIILPSSFTGGARYMIQNYQDAMVICRWIGYPNLFITFTCNPKWPEIQRYVVKRNLRAEDRPDIVCRIFKMKLDFLIKEFKSGGIFGVFRAVIYTIEFQKRGLPHAHILLFLARKEVNSATSFMDTIISAEIPDKERDREYYNVVAEFMIHGPCGAARKKSPCMVNGRCSKHFPKRFVECSSLDEDGYPIYRRHDDGMTVTKNGMQLDNRYVVPHNRALLLKYRAHMNVEWCNQSRSIKYLFKYVNKGNDRVTAELYRNTVDTDGNEIVDEINMYYNYRYVSAFEATWLLLSFDVQYRTPSVERLSFHLPDCQCVVFNDDDSVTEVLNRHTVGQNICTFNGIEYITFRDACYARGLLDDDKEYIDVIEEASHWSSAHSMRKLFVTLLITNSLNRPENVWNEVWHHLAEDARFNQRRLLQKPDLEQSTLNGNRLLLEELSYDRAALSEESAQLTNRLTDEQKSKTFLWRALYATLRSKGEIVLNVASSGIASLLQPGGRTAHSRFAIPINITEDSTCNITPGSDLAELILKTRFISWDEAPMMHKHCFEALDRTMRDLLRFVNPRSAHQTFGGKTVVLSGDFRQILPVVPKGTRQDIVAATINTSYLWDNCKVLRLTKNLRLKSMSASTELQRLENFAKWIAGIGDETIGCLNDGSVEDDIPPDMLLPSSEIPLQL
ncbi:PREDICTED: uncharacterized protein LOC109159959 [Ipomoea nil]|uniref:uncharacterized protein LOC109159959 n=1 Tax=Ipomoea nil TaxID=35883 RepID=UPI000900B86A|nr:PREDICTED: uncharacterized protein LOC109159959 [Ipomoea nil]